MKSKQAKRGKMKVCQTDIMKEMSTEEVKVLVEDAVSNNDLFELVLIAKMLHYNCRSYENSKLIFTAANKIFKKDITSNSDLLYTLGVLNSTYHGYKEYLKHLKMVIRERLSKSAKKELKKLPSWVNLLINKNDISHLLFHFNENI